MTKFLDYFNAIKLLREENSLKKPITIKFLAAGLTPLLLFGAISFWLLSSLSTDLVTQSFTALKANKVINIEDYGKTIVNQVITASANPNTADNLIILSRAYAEVVDEAFEENDTEEFDYDEDIYIDFLRSELGEYYENEFSTAYRAANEEKLPDTTSMLANLSSPAVVLQHAYIHKNASQLGNKNEMYKSAMNSKYDLNHTRLHETFNIYLEKFGYYDIFLVDNRGNIIYSVFKEIDFATNLNTGPFSTSGLADAYKEALNLTEPNDYVLIDYAQYTPSYESPASFIASPVFKYGNRVGVLIFQMPLEAISSVMSERKGLGQTGEAYLVGQDKFMRSDSYKDPDNLSVENAFRKNIKVSSQSIELGLNGQSGIIETDNYLGEEVLSAYTPVNFGDLQWAMVAEIETSEAFSAVTRMIWIITIIVIVVAICIFYFALKVADKIINPITSLQQAMARITEKSDFSERVLVETNDEIGHSAEVFNTLLEGFELSISETNKVVSAMANGDFSTQVESECKGDLLILKEGVNASMKAMGDSICEMNRVVVALANGDFDQRIDIQLHGELHTLKTSVNESISSMKFAMGEISDLIQEMSKGNFKGSATRTLPGDYNQLIEEANSAMSSVDSAVTEIDIVMSAVSQGILDSRIEAILPGQLSQIKENVNASLSVIADVFSQTESVLTCVADGKLHRKIEKEFPGQFNSLKVSTNITLAKLTEVVNEIKQTATAVNSSAIEISNGNHQLSERTVQQSSDLESTAASMEEITVTVKKTEENATHANEMAKQAKEFASKGGIVVKDAIEAMNEINDASGKIASIISVIDAIAFQTNLLALNAAVEAARAGEQGRGFAVVASEVRNLAGRSSNAAQEISSLINDTVNKVQIGAQLVSHSGTTLEDIITQVENVDNIVREISLAAVEQSKGVQGAQRAMESLQTLTQQNTSMAEEGTAASENLKIKANNMTQLMEFFETQIKSEMKQ